MAAWYDTADELYDRQEAALDGPYDGVVGYPDWSPAEASVDELCASIDAAVLTFGRLADETADLTALVARRVA